MIQVSPAGLPCEKRILLVDHPLNNERTSQIKRHVRASGCTRLSRLKHNKEEEERFVDEVAEKGEYLIRPWGDPTPVRLLFILRKELSWVQVPSILHSDASVSSYF